MLRAAILLIASSIAGLAQLSVEAPRIALLRDSSGRLRPLWGVAGNMVAGEPLLDGVVSAECSGGWCLVKREQELLLLDQAGQQRLRWQAPPGRALYAFDASGDPALVYFQGTRQLCRIAGDSLVPVAAFGEELLSIGWAEQGRAQAVVEAGECLALIAIDLDSGITEHWQALPAARTALLLPQGGLVMAVASDLVLCREGAEKRLPLPSPPAELWRLSEDWIALRLEGDSSLRAVRLGNLEDGLVYLPEAGS